MSFNLCKSITCIHSTFGDLNVPIFLLYFLFCPVITTNRWDKPTKRQGNVEKRHPKHHEEDVWKEAVCCRNIWRQTRWLPPSSYQQSMGGLFFFLLSLSNSFSINSFKICICNFSFSSVYPPDCWYMLQTGGRKGPGVHRHLQSSWEQRCHLKYARRA